MKKKLAVLLVCGMTAGLCLSGCGGAEEEPESAAVGEDLSEESGAEGNAESGSSDEQETAESGGSGYQFESNGTSFGVDVDIEPVLSALGEADSVYETPSCAGDGTAYVYNYGSFEIQTYPDGDKNMIGYIMLKDDTVATPEGIDLSMTKEDITGAYGTPSSEDDHGLVYEKGGMKLKFVFEGDNIVSIEYTSPVIG